MNNGFGKVGLTIGNRGGNNNAVQLVQIIKLPESLANNAKALRLEGQITNIDNQTNTARIQTPQGDVDVKVSNKGLETGQRLTVELPAGNPPRQARVAPQPIIKIPENNAGPTIDRAPKTENITIRTQPNTPAPQPPPTLTQKVIEKITQKITGTPPPVISNKQTEGQQITQPNQYFGKEILDQTTTRLTQNIPQEVAKQLAAQAIKNLPDIAQALKPNDVVRVLSAPPNLAQSIATQTTQNVTPLPQTATPILNSNGLTFFTPSVSTQPPALSASSNNALNPLQIITNSLLAVPSPGASPSASSPQVIQSNLPTQISSSQIINTTQILNATQVNAALQNISSINLNAAQNIAANAPQPVVTTSLQPITFNPATPNVVTVQNTPQLDIQIVKIVPPATNITAPNTVNAGNTGNNTAPIAQTIPAATQFVSPSILANTPATAITAQVTGFTSQGLPLITAKLPGATLPQSFILQYRTNNLVLGSQLQIIPKAGQALSPLALQPQSTNPLLQGFQWPALDELYNSLLQISPQAAASLGRSLPSASNPSQMGAAAMMFIAAVKTGDMNGFLGDKKIDMLQRLGKENLLSRLTLGGDAGARAAPEMATSSEWRAVPLPMFWEGEIQRITLYTRRENQNQQDNQNDNKNGQTRFVFDLSLTRMGKVQLDGFLKDQRLDLVVRTENAFSQPMQQTMRQAYSGALDQTSLTGDLTFQGSTDKWVHVLENEKQFGADA